MDENILIPVLGIIFSLGVLPLSILYFINRGQDKKLETIIKVVELGGAVDPQMLKMLGDSHKDYKSDYKAGLIWLAIGLPVFAGIWLESGASEAIFGSIPALIGAAYVISGKYRLRGEDDK
ncbi:MAG: hypothetical protein COB20_12840 [SAR86 cluster bacterium]|uniref:DUF6249 domain-containing protein n=1 Tax=SAR86 cluster bacterium TaxID=2030880 RepID=A0A2A4WYH8_9GAMM|nr:MAG: hypothetical protein COB20_12840 [SAR86 cluster bacterium]